MKSSSSISLVIAFMILVILYITNPKEYQFNKHLNNTFTEEAFAQGGFTGAVKSLFVGPKTWLMSLTTKRHNLMFFSIYTVEGLDRKYTYIGILSFFIELPNSPYNG